MNWPRLLLLPFLIAGLGLAGCSGPKPGPPPPAPAEAGVALHYQRAYAALLVHPAVQSFAADHLDPSETLAIAVSAELVPLDYAVVAADLAQPGSGRLLPERVAVVEDSLAALAASDRFAPFTDDALPLLSMRQQRPLVLFFGEMNDGRLPAQLYPNPYRREGFEAVRAGTPGLALLVVFEGGAIAEVYAGPLGPR